MLTALFEFFDRVYDLPGAGVFQYITFRSAMAAIFSLLISLVFGKRIIALIRRQQVGETVRDLGLEGQKEKEGKTQAGTVILTNTKFVRVIYRTMFHIYYSISNTRNHFSTRASIQKKSMGMYNKVLFSLA